MDQKLNPNTQPSAPDLELIINQKIKDINSFNNSLQNINLMMKYYEEQNNKNKKKYKKLKNINKFLNTFDTLIIISSTTSSITLSILGIGLIVIPIIAPIGLDSAISSKIISEFLNKQQKIYFERYCLSNEYLSKFRQFYMNSLQDNKIEKSEYTHFLDMYKNYTTEKKINNKLIKNLFYYKFIFK